MYTISQIILFVLVFLIMVLSAFMFIYYFKLKNIEKKYGNLIKYFTAALFISFTTLYVLIFIYLIKFIAYFGWQAALLSLIIFLILLTALANSVFNSRIRQILMKVRLK